jgi:CxxH/CxxC protein (TIGR04129 family)
VHPSHEAEFSDMLCVDMLDDNQPGIGSVKTLYCVCKEHIERALDRFVDEYEDAPDVVDLKETQFADWDPPRKCDLCDEAAAFLVV